MKNKGFTLIEMLGIITVVGVILLVVFPNISKSIQSMKKLPYLLQKASTRFQVLCTAHWLNTLM